MAANMQYMIRQNAQKMQDTMSDLYDWENDINEKDAKLGGAGTGKAGKGQVRTVSGGVRAAPVRATAATGARKGLNVPAPRSAAETPAEAGGDLITQMGNVQKRHAERELQIAKEEKEREEASKKKEDWKSGNMGDFYKKWDKFDESDAPDAEEEAPSNAQKAAPKVNQKLGPGGIGLLEPVDAADIPAASQMPRGLGENITALDDPTLNGGAREKDKGNSLYQDKRFGEAVAAYTRGLDVLYGKAAAECTATEQLQALKATLYCNRAMAHLKLENWELADADASSSLDLDPAMVKAYLRRGAARREQHRYADAVQDFERVLQIDPTNKDGIKQLGKAVQLVSKFGKAAKRGASAGGPAKGFFGASSAKADRSSGGAGGKKGKDKGLVFAFEGSKKQKARAEEKPWRVKIPIREVDGFVSAFVDDDLGEDEPEPEVSMGPSVRPPAGAAKRPASAPARATPTAAAQAAASTPRTGYELERSLKALKATPQQLRSWLLGLPVTTVPKLMKSILTAETLLAIVEPLATFDEDDAEVGTAKKILTLLIGIACTSRFGMTVQFLSAGEQYLVNTLFEKIEARSAEDGLDAAALAKAQKDYRVPKIA